MKTLKSIIIACLYIIICTDVTAKDLTGVRIYINPGHGGFDAANDRNVVTIPYAANDINGFWESSCSLTKGLALRDMLEAHGATVMMSRTENRDEDDRNLTEIAEEASANSMDAFLSIHSNAVGVNQGTNYLLLLYRGTDDEPDPALSKPMAQACWSRMYDNPLTNWTYYSATNMNVRGDYSFYGYHLGVLRNNTVPGFLSEGEFHDYLPETHRLLNEDYRKLESARFFRYFCDYFEADQASKGILAGLVKSSNERINNPLYLYKTGTNDQWLPVNKAKVELFDNNGTLIDSYVTDECYNGFYSFFDLEPGKYKLKITAENYAAADIEAEVKAGETTSLITQIENKNVVTEKEVPADYPEPDQEAGTVAMPFYKTQEISKNTFEWLQDKNIRKSLLHNKKLYILTTEPKIYIADPNTGDLISELKLTGIEGGILPISDIAFSADGYLMACNKNIVTLPADGEKFKVYTWNDDESDPILFFETTQQGNFSASTIGETFAISGPRWKCNIYTPAITTGTSKQIRIVGYQIDEELPNIIGYKYMMDTTKYTEALWGETFTFTISPLGTDRLIIDSEKLMPTEFGFDWTAADRSPLTEHGAINEGILSPQAKGANFFQYARHSFMISPDCSADHSHVSAILFDITDGLDKAVKISEKMPDDGLSENAVPYMMAAGIVNGYDIDLYLYAQNAGIARYQTITTTATANIYASGLQLESTGQEYKFSFILNENANEVFIEFVSGEKILKSYSAGTLSKGNHTISMTKAEIPAGKDMHWQIKATAESVARPVKMTGDEETLKFYNAYGVAIDNNPESPYFGRIYVASSKGGTSAGRTTDQGIYIMDPLFGDITNQSNKAYDGGITWSSSNSPFRLAIAPDGRVFMCDFSDGNSGIYVMDPSKPNEKFISLFEGLTRDTNGLASNTNNEPVHGSSSSCYVTGSGENTILYTFDEDYKVDGKAGNILQYNIGTTTHWTEAPSIAFNNAATGGYQANMNSTILPDGRGGWWISQYRAADEAAVPSLIHYNGTQVDFVSGKTDPTIIENSRNGGMAISLDGTRIAMGCNNEIKILGISYNEEGIPSIKRLHSIKPGIGANSNSLAFDWGGNVYLISNSGERLGMWALPKADNTSVTPAPSSQTISKEIGTVVNLEATAAPEGISLSWEEPEGSVGTPEYNIYRGSELITTVTGTTYTDEISEDGEYSYSVTAVYGTYETEKATVSIKITGIEESTMGTSLYPNPTDGPVNIESEETIHSIQVFDINGRTILNMNNLNTNKETISLYEQSGGVYIIKINGMTYRIIRK